MRVSDSVKVENALAENRKVLFVYGNVHIVFFVDSFDFQVDKSQHFDELRNFRVRLMIMEMSWQDISL